jgi:hypothetical protein
MGAKSLEHGISHDGIGSGISDPCAQTKIYSGSQSGSRAYCWIIECCVTCGRAKECPFSQ